jgi:hypothetical protein
MPATVLLPAGELDRHVEEDLSARVADSGDQPRTSFNTHPPTVAVGEYVAEGGVVPGTVVTWVLLRRRDVYDVLRAELDSELQHPHVTVGGWATGAYSVSGRGQDSHGGQGCGRCGCAEPQPA